MAKAKFPKTLYVRREDDDSDHYFLAQETTLGIVDADQEEEVGVYQLVKRVKATAPTELKELSRAK